MAVGDVLMDAVDRQRAIGLTTCSLKKYGSCPVIRSLGSGPHTPAAGSRRPKAPGWWESAPKQPGGRLRSGGVVVAVVWSRCPKTTAARPDPGRHLPPGAQHPPVAQTGRWMLVNFGAKDLSAWLEEDFFGDGATSWTNGWDAETTLSLVAESGFPGSGVVSG